MPAAAGRDRLVSEAGEAVKVVKCFIKPRGGWAADVVAGGGA